LSLVESVVLLGIIEAVVRACPVVPGFPVEKVPDVDDLGEEVEGGEGPHRGNWTLPAMTTELSIEAMVSVTASPVDEVIWTLRGTLRGNVTEGPAVK